MSQTETLQTFIAIDGSVLKARTTKELHRVNKFRLMFGKPLFPDSETEGMPPANIETKPTEPKV